MTKIVETKEELKCACEEKIDKIIAVGSLAEDMKKASAINKMTKASIVALIISVGAVATAPITGGVSLVGAAPVIATKTGIDVAAIAVIATLGLTFVLTVFKDYSVKFKVSANGGVEAEFTRKK